MHALSVKMTSILHTPSSKGMMFRIAISVITLAFASQLSIPLEPVPLTFQSAAVVLLGMLFGARYGCYIALSYVLLGALGLPIYANFVGGISKLIGPTGGYLCAFPLAAYVAGFLAERGFARSYWKSLVTAILSASLIFGLGVSWLSLFVGFSKALQLGVMPFLFSEVIKLATVAALIPFCWRDDKF